LEVLVMFDPMVVVEGDRLPDQRQHIVCQCTNILYINKL
jgi:hypothetical protein